MEVKISDIASKLTSFDIARFPFNNGELMIFITKSDGIAAVVSEKGIMIDAIHGNTPEELERKFFAKYDIYAVEYKGTRLYKELIND